MFKVSMLKIFNFKLFATSHFGAFVWKRMALKFMQVFASLVKIEPLKTYIQDLLKKFNQVRTQTLRAEHMLSRHQ